MSMPGSEKTEAGILLLDDGGCSEHVAGLAVEHGTERLKDVAGLT